MSLNALHHMENYRDILALFDKRQSFALSTHVSPDGDALGAELALYAFLKDNGKEVRVFNTDPTPKIYQFLPFCDIIGSPAMVGDFSPEILVVLDAGELERIGEKLSQALLPSAAIVNIDHHTTAERFGDYNLVKTDASSTCEIIYELICAHGASIGQERAICLYTGIMFDTGCFRYASATPVAHRIAAVLIQEGARADEIYRHVYETSPAGQVRLLGEVLATLEITPDGKIAWAYATQEMFRNTGTNREHVDGFINHLRSIDSVEVVILVSEQENSDTKASFRSKSLVDVGKIAAEFGGGGHARAAGCELKVPYKAAIDLLVDHTKKFLLDGHLSR